MHEIAKRHDQQNVKERHGYRRYEIAQSESKLPVLQTAFDVFDDPRDQMKRITGRKHQAKDRKHQIKRSDVIIAPCPHCMSEKHHAGRICKGQIADAEDAFKYPHS